MKVLLTLTREQKVHNFRICLTNSKISGLYPEKTDIERKHPLL